MHKRVRAVTLTEVSAWCEESGDDPVVAVGELLSGHHEGTDVLGLLVVSRTQGRKDALNVA